MAICLRKFDASGEFTDQSFKSFMDAQRSFGSAKWEVRGAIL